MRDWSPSLRLGRRSFHEPGHGESMFWRLSDSTLTVHRNAPVWANDRMELTLTYTITRQEVSEWYWRTWRRKLWMYHVFFAVVALWTVIAGRGMWPPDLLTIVYGVLTGICVVLFFIVFPQIMFKPSLRTLTVNESGIETTIGGRSRSVSGTKSRISRSDLNLLLSYVQAGMPS
jgi:hypothetical protein